MQSFEITIDGAAHPGTFATLAEAEAVANTFRTQQPGKSIAARPKVESTANDGLGTVQNVDPSKVLLQKDGVIFEQGADAAAQVHNGVPTPLDAQPDAGQPAVAPRQATGVPPAITNPVRR